MNITDEQTLFFRAREAVLKCMFSEDQARVIAELESRIHALESATQPASEETSDELFEKWWEEYNRPFEQELKIKNSAYKWMAAIGWNACRKAGRASKK